MRPLSKTKFARAIEGEAGARTQGQALAPAPRKSKRSSRILIFAFVVAIGIAAGWLAGGVLNGQLLGSSAVAPGTDQPADDTSSLQPPPDTKPPAKHTSAVNPSPSESTAEAEQPDARPAEPEPRVSPPRTPKVGKDDNDVPEAPSAEDPTGAIGRDALKKMLRDVKRMKRGLANKNENYDEHME